MVFQQFNLFPHMSALRNVALAPVRVRGLSWPEATARAEALLERVGLRDHQHKRPGQLSGGQQQRVAIARALAMQPELLLFDEPTSALDPEMVQEVLDVIQDIARTGATLLIVTHEMSFARKVADRVVFMEQGRIVEIAPPETFFTNPATDRAGPSSIPPRADAAACPPEPSTRVLPMRHDHARPGTRSRPNAGPGLDTGPNPGPNQPASPAPAARHGAGADGLADPAVGERGDAPRRRAALLVRRIRQPDRGRHPRGRQPVAGAGRNPLWREPGPALSAPRLVRAT